MHPSAIAMYEGPSSSQESDRGHEGLRQVGRVPAVLAVALETLLVLLAGQGASAIVRAASMSYTALAGGLSTGLEARHVMMTSLTSAGHSSGTLQDSKRRHEKSRSPDSRRKLV